MSAGTSRDRAHGEVVRVVGAATGERVDRVLWLGAEDDAPEAARHRAVPVVALDGVLEQVDDAAAVLRRLTGLGVLAEDGSLVVSVRNARHDAVLDELRSGTPAGTGSGLLDRGQRAWFTLETLRDTLESTGFTITEVHRVRHRVAGSGGAAGSDAAVGSGDARAGGADETGDVESYVVVARPSGAAARVAELTAQLAAARTDTESRAGEVAAAAHRLAGVQSLLDEERAEHARLVEAGRKELVALRAENAELTTRLEAGGRELTEARAASAQTLTSPAYLAGERVLRATASVRAIGARVRGGLGSARRRPR